jgi:iron complex outermembrane receptor protein
VSAINQKTYIKISKNRGRFVVSRNSGFYYGCVFTVVTALFISPQAVFAEHPLQLPDLTVPGQDYGEFSSVVIDTGTYVKPLTDAGAIMKQVPGGNFNTSGALSGQTSYRGFFGPRMNVRLDGMYVESGGPNWMDPPLHYMPATLLESVEVQRGIASVSSGSGIGGYVQAKAKSSKFVDSDEMQSHGDFTLGGHEADSGFNGGGVLSTSNRNHRVHLLGSYDKGSDTQFGGGEIADTAYRRTFGGVGYGYQGERNEFTMDLRHSNSGPAGTPALPMDIEFLKTNLFNTSFDTTIGNFDIETRFFTTDVRHRMNNYSWRPAPDFSGLPLPPFVGTDERFVNAESDSDGFELTAETALANGTLKFGADWKGASHDATVGDPAVAAFYITNFNDAESDNYGFFTEWKKNSDETLGVELGLRLTQVEMDADVVSAFPADLADGGLLLPPTIAAQTLRNDFNTRDRSVSDTNIDAVVKLDYTVNDTLDAELGFARKVRSPSYIERYLWIPLEVSAGLGDGNNYIGNPDLDPEDSYQVELGLSWNTSRAYFSPRAYYRRIDDYIQGTPTTNTAAIIFSTTAAGDPTPMEFTNVDAEIYGFDTGWGFEITDQWQLDGIVSYTRGKRRDIDDNLYRIAPLNTNLALTHHRETWSATVEGVFVDSQDKISDTITLDPANPNNSNAETPGYILMNLSTQWAPKSGITLNAGIENVLDKDYTDHLTGFNRVSDSDVAIGSRMPGIGRNLFASINYQF